MASRWANWSNGLQRRRYFTDYIVEGQQGAPMEGDPAQIAAENGWQNDGHGNFKDANGVIVGRVIDGVMYSYSEGNPSTSDTQMDTGNPTPAASAMKPADRAASMGLQSNGKGGYVDPNTGQTVARTVNNELVFYDQGPGGGAVSDGAGGQALAQDTPSWQDPVTGLVITPPAKPESPQELAAIPDPVPAQSPHGYNQFIMQRKMMAYAQNKAEAEQAPPPPEEDPDAEMDMGVPPQAGQQADAMMPEDYNPASLFKRANPQPQSFQDLRSRMNRATPPQPQQPVTSNRPREDQLAQQARMATSPAGLQGQDTPQAPAPQAQPTPQAQPAPEAKPDISQAHPEPHKDPILDHDGDGDVEPDDIKDIVKDNESLMDFVRGKQAELLQNDKKVQTFMDKKFAKFQDSLGSIENEEVRKSMEDLFRKAYGFEGRVNVGAGLNSLGKLDIENLTKAREALVDGVDYNDKEAIAQLVKTIRKTEVSPEFLDASFNALPPQLVSGWKNKGNAGKGEFAANHYLGNDADGNEMRGNLGKNDRAKLMWKYFLEQGGVDGYTGQPLDINNFDLEHLLPASQSGDMDEFNFREGPNNHVLVNSNVNQSKSDLSMEDWFKKQVDPMAEKDDDYWSSRDKIMDFRNTIGPREEGLVQSILSGADGKDFGENLDLDTLMGHFDHEDNYLKDEKKILREFAKKSGDKELMKEAGKIETASGLAKALAMKMGLPRGYNKQKNVPGAKVRTNSLGSDNYYRAVVASMLGKDPEARGKMAQTYKDALRAAEDATAPGDGGMGAFVKHMVDNGGVDIEMLQKYPRLMKLFQGGAIEEEKSPEDFYNLLWERLDLTGKYN